MQNDIKIEYCDKHLENKIEGFCEDCKEFFCKECKVNHLGHLTKTLNKFCEERKNTILSKISINEFMVQLKGRTDKTIKERQKLDKDYDDINKTIALKETTIDESRRDCYRDEIERIEAVTRYLVGLEDEASTIALKNACEEAIVFFDLEDKIKGEFAECLEEVEKMKEIEGEIKTNILFRVFENLLCLSRCTVEFVFIGSAEIILYFSKHFLDLAIKVDRKGKFKKKKIIKIMLKLMKKWQ